MKTTIGRIKSVLKEIGKCKFKYEEDIRDYSYNGIDVSSINQEYYLDLQKDFYEHFANLLSSDKVDKPLIAFLFKTTAEYHNSLSAKKDTFRVNYLFDKGDEKLRDLSEWTHEVINSIMDAQKSTLKKIYYFLNNIYGELDYLTIEDKNEFKEEFKEEFGGVEDNSQIITQPSLGKINFLGTKKDGLCLLFLLEYFGLIDFQNTNRNRFIEKNFTYGKNKDMKSINSDITNFYDNVDKVKIATNRTSTTKLIKKISASIDEFDFKKFLLAKKL